MASSRVCIDANLVVRVVAEPGNHSIQDLWRRWRQDGTSVVAPALLHFEVTDALYRYHSSGPMSIEWVRAALTAALALPIEVRTDPQLHTRAVDMAERLGLPAAYDAHYLALADALSLPFWTADRRLFDAVGKRLAWVSYAG